MDWLLKLDTDILLAVNGAHSAFGDAFMYFISKKLVWIPVYAVLLAVMVWKLGWKNALIALLLIGASVGIADFVSSGIIKPMALRLRPCHEITLRPLLHLVNNKCGGQYGFVSSHSANFFAMAFFLSWLFKTRMGKWSILFFIIAGMVAFSRVYLGVHYPSDILAGMLVGIAASGIGITIFKIVLHKLGFPQTHRQ